MQSPEHSHDGGGVHEHLDEGLVQAWLDGQLSSDEARDVEARAAACAECAAVVAEARGLAAAASRILGALDPDTATPAMRDASLERTRALVRETPGAEAPRVEPAPRVVPIASARRRRRWAVPATIAATVLVGALSLLNDRERAGRGAFELKSAADESGARAVAASAPPSATPLPASPMPVVSPRVGVPADSNTVARRGFADRAGQPRRAEADAAASRANVEPQRTMAPSEQLRVAESRALAPAPSVAPPAAPAPQRSAALADTFAGRVATNQAIARARRDSAVTVQPLEAPELARADRREAAPTQKTAVGSAVSAAEGVGDATIVGRVTDQNLAPIAGASVAVSALGVGTTTQQDGRFSLTIPAGRRGGDSVVVTARRIGFNPTTRAVRLPERGSVALDLTLTTAAMALQEVVVTGVDAARAASGCWVVQSGGSALPQAFVLDPIASGQARGSVRGGAASGAGPIVGSWSAMPNGAARISFESNGRWVGTLHPAERGETARLVIAQGSDVVIRGGESRAARTQAAPGNAPAETVVVRQVTCRR